MEPINKFLIRGIVKELVRREVAYQGKTFVKCGIVVSVKTVNDEPEKDVFVLTKVIPDDLTQGDTVEIKGYLKSRYWEGGEKWFSDIVALTVMRIMHATGPSNDVKQPSNDAKHISVAMPDFAKSQVEIANANFLKEDEDIPF